MARLRTETGQTQTGDCVAPLAFERGANTALHQPSLSRRTNQPDPDYETGANKRDDYEEVGRHGPRRYAVRCDRASKKRRSAFCLLKLLTGHLVLRPLILVAR